MDPLREWYTNVSCWATASGYLELQFQNRRNLGLQQAWFDLSRFEHIFAFLYLFQNHVHRISAVNRKNFGTSFTTRCFEVPKMGNCCMVEDCRFALTSLSRSNRVLWYTYAICIHICFVFFKAFLFRLNYQNCENNPMSKTWRRTRAKPRLGRLVHKNMVSTGFEF